MIVKSTKHVDLPDGEYIGAWMNWVVTIPFEENENMEIPVSHGSENVVIVRLKIKNNSFIFDTDKVTYYNEEES